MPSQLIIDLDTLTSERAALYVALLQGATEPRQLTSEEVLQKLTTGGNALSATHVGERISPKNDETADALDAAEIARFANNSACANIGIDMIPRADGSAEILLNGKHFAFVPAKDVSIPVSLSAQAVAAMDETAGIVPQSAAPLPPAPSTAAAEAPPTAPVDPSVFSTGSAPVPAPPVPDAPMADVPPAPVGHTTAAPGGEVDVHGLPWDERIHAGTRARIEDGSWRKRRGVPDDVVATVTAELRARMAPVNSPHPTMGHDMAPLTVLVPAAPAASEAPLPPPVPAAPATDPVPSAPATPFNTAPPAPPVNTPSGRPAATNWIELVQKCSSLVTAQFISQAEIDAAVLETAGVANLMHLGTAAPEVIAQVDAAIERVCAA